MVSCNVLSCWAQLVSVCFFFFWKDVKFSQIVIHRSQKTEATSTIENCIVTQSKLLIGSPR